MILSITNLKPEFLEFESGNQKFKEQIYEAVFQEPSEEEAKF